MKATLLCTFCFLLMAGFARGQFLDATAKAAAAQLASPKEKAEWVSHQMTERYGLSHEQSNVVKLAFLQRAQAGNDQNALPAFRQALQAGLSPEQYRLFKADNDQYAKNQSRSRTMNKTLGNKQAAETAERGDEWSEILY
jgi:hypothetical protein